MCPSPSSTGSTNYTSVRSSTTSPALSAPSGLKTSRNPQTPTNSPYSPANQHPLVHTCSIDCSDNHSIEEQTVFFFMHSSSLSLSLSLYLYVCFSLSSVVGLISLGMENHTRNIWGFCEFSSQLSSGWLLLIKSFLIVALFVCFVSLQLFQTRVVYIKIFALSACCLFTQNTTLVFLYIYDVCPCFPSVTDSPPVNLLIPSPFMEFFRFVCF